MRGARLKSHEARFDVKFLANSVGHARIGYVVPKRLVPKAVRRNAIKRLIREAFRLDRQDLPAIDLVVRQIARETQISKAVLAAEIRALLVRLHHV